MREECDYEHEAEQQEYFRRLWLGRPEIRIPRVFRDLSTRRILATELCHGESLESFGAHATQAETNRAGKVIFEFYWDSVLRGGRFQADPHPGNLSF
jgi:predicted unusual protein kinase regulating ubiquinone biosynthesis (AarF/ABC1/UbiB family)